MSDLEGKRAASIAWFEIPASNLERARAFYTELFEWRINPFAGTNDYLHIETGGSDHTPDGALKRRTHPQEQVTNYVNVDSVDAFVHKIEKLGGEVTMGKTAVLQMGYFALCRDTEGNAFGIWENDPAAA